MGPMICFPAGYQNGILSCRRLIGSCLQHGRGGYRIGPYRKDAEMVRFLSESTDQLFSETASLGVDDQEGSIALFHNFTSCPDPERKVDCLYTGENQSDSPGTF